MPIFKSKFPDVALPQHTNLSDFIFSTWTSKDEAKPAYIDGFSYDKLTFGEFRSLTHKVREGAEYRKSEE